MIVYGSYAMKFWFPEFRTPKDIDIVQLDSEDYNNDLIERLKKENLPIEIKEAAFFYPLEDKTQNNILSPEGMLTVRMSHAMYDIHWEKAIEDIIFLQRKGVNYDLESLKILRKGWKKVHKGFREKMNMNVPPEIFFNSNVKRYYNHDELHELIKIDKIPAFQKILKDDITVAVSRKKFENLNFDEKIHTVLEEVCVLACERHFDKSVKTAYKHALKDFVTRMTSGWYNIFVLENIDYFWNYNNEDMFYKMNQIIGHINKGILKDG